MTNEILSHRYHNHGGPTPCSPTTDIGSCPYSNYSLDITNIGDLLVPELMEEKLPFPGLDGCMRCSFYMPLTGIIELEELAGLRSSIKTKELIPSEIDF